MKTGIVRTFTGKLHIDRRYNSPEMLESTKHAQHYYDRMLRAYLKGKPIFQYGTEQIMGYAPRPIMHKVEYSLVQE